MEKPKIGLLGLTLELYKTKAPSMIPSLENFSGELREILSDRAEIVHYPLGYNRKTISEAFSKFSGAGVDGIILVFLSYSPSLVMLPSLKKTDIPILIFNTQKLEKIGLDFSPKDSSSNHGMHGVQDLASVLLREKIKFSLITGHCKKPATLEKVSSWCMAARAASRLSKARVGRIGGLFKDMGDFAMESEVLRSATGTGTVEVSEDELSQFHEFPEPSNEEIENVLDFRIEWSPDVDNSSRINAMKAYFFMKELSVKKDISGWAVNFEGIGQFMPMPFLGVSCLLKEGMGYGGEGDIFSATAVLLAQAVSKGKATFTEMFTTDYKNSRIYMTHMGESNLGLRRKDEPVKMFLNKMALGNGIPSVVPSFSICPGKYTLLNLAGSSKNSLRMIISTVEVLDVKPFREMKTPHFLIQPEKKVEEFLTDYSLQGGTHHIALASGDIRESLKFFGFIKGLETVEI
ncbi:MAG TPA: hypothetical protein PKN36_07450 [bacterium]|nr:hypothetical protein [bacterium]